jgi:hypothetical protein
MPGFVKSLCHMIITVPAGIGPFLIGFEDAIEAI